MAGSGNRSMVLNTRERLLSDDHNRLQAFLSGDVSAVLAYLLLTRHDTDFQGNGVETLSSTTDTPTTACVIDGLRPFPVNGTTSMLITAGVVVMADPDSVPSPDDAPWKWVVDPGVQLVGQLTLTAGTGSTRIDVIECQRTLAVLEQDNRDVFNPATGLFSPSLVTKVQAGRLVYRIRTGTPGAGYPGGAAGWLPLAIASVPSTATTWDSVTLWDVRPLAADRASGLLASTRVVPWQRRSLAYCDALTNVAAPHVWAEVDTEFGGYRAGGIIRKNTATIYIDPTDSAHWTAGFAFGTTGALWHVYLLFPFGLPRWVRYSDVSAGARVPSAQRGIVTISSQVSDYSGLPHAGIQSPAGYGLGDSAGFNAVLAYCGRGPKSPGTAPIGMHCDGKVWTFVNADTFALTSNTPTTTAVSWNLGSTLVPGSARALYIRLRAEFQFPAPAVGGEGVGTIDGIITVSDFSQNTSSQASIGVEGESTTEVDSNQGSNPGVLFIRQFAVRVPLQPYTWPIPSQAALRSFALLWTHNAGLAPTNCSATILGWELGP